MDKTSINHSNFVPQLSNDELFSISDGGRLNQSCDLRASNYNKPTVGHILGNTLDDISSSNGRKILLKKHGRAFKCRCETKNEIQNAFQAPKAAYKTAPTKKFFLEAESAVE